MSSPRVDLGPAASSCTSAASDARACAEAPGVDTDCRDLCSDAAEVLAALASMLSRRATPRRTAGIRRMIEAGLTAAIECAAECERLGDGVPAARRCGDSCEAATSSLRRLLTDFVDDEIDEKSGAT